MGSEDDAARRISVCSAEVSPSEVDAGADMTLTGKVLCSPVGDLRGATLLVKDQDGALVHSIELAEFDGEANETGQCVVKAPVRPGAYTWMAVYPAYAEAGVSHETTSVPCSFTVRPHKTRVVVWDTPSAIECGEKFRVKIGVKCSSECRPDGWAFEVRDHDGNELARARLNENPWPGTAALHYAEVDFTAPDTEGLYTWEAKAPGAGLGVPHAECVENFCVRVVPAPECLLTVEAMDADTRTPVKGAKVVLHPYRAVTDERGIAEVKVPKGEYRLFVSGKNYFPFRSDREVSTDMTIRAELAADPVLSDAEIWS